MPSPCLGPTDIIAALKALEFVEEAKQTINTIL